jgi:malate synthase
VSEVAGVQVVAEPVDGQDEILTPAALEFIAGLQRSFGVIREQRLAGRADVRARIVRTGGLDFLPETADIRGGEWRVADAPADLQDRRVEITGPTEAKMAINALNSGAEVWLADFEDANTPHWANVIGGQLALRSAVRRELSFSSPEGKHYTLRTDGPLATMVIRPRGWHLDERHILVDGKPCSASLVDFGLYFFHNATELLARGSGPYFYLPKMESHLEARLWNDVFTYAQAERSIPHGSVRATVLIETIPAAFVMEEILYELRQHASGLNAGRWDYLFSIIKNFRDQGREFVLPDRNQVTMTAPMMRAYTELLVRTCHKRGAFAIGGMAAFIPSRRDAAVNAAALTKVRADKEREAGDGFDGSWVAHPDLVPVCREVFDGVLGARSNQLDRTRDEVMVTADQILAVDETPGTRTVAGLRDDISVGLRYLGAWLGGSGAVGINNLMEDAATAEISRSLIWQWVHNGVTLDDGTMVTAELVRSIAAEELARAVEELGDPHGHYVAAAGLFETVALTDDFADFLTIPAYALID